MVIDLLVRAVEESTNDPQVPVCAANNEYNGDLNLRILSVFMILISSAIGSFAPLILSNTKMFNVPSWFFFIAKFFGSGVIIATSFIHLLSPATDALSNDCLGPGFTDYPWSFAIALISLFVLFFVELIVYHYMSKADRLLQSPDVHYHKHSSMNSHGCTDDQSDLASKKSKNIEKVNEDIESCNINDNQDEINTNFNPMLGKDHFSHKDTHQDRNPSNPPLNNTDEGFYNQLVAVLFFESGIVFHSVFIGLSLAVAGSEFKTLFVVLVFHQMFEALGLGARLVEVEWKKDKRWMPWLLALGFSLCTPIAIAIGIGVRNSWTPESKGALITNGIFDSISAGILIYTGLVELIAHEFLFSNQFKNPNGFKQMMLAYFVMCIGAGLMALLGKWA
ncbi:hypothetical protein Kpol_1006p10 [Vanderwaltozyma polyspora DSM 70294]|uniref:Zinc-regulated transporter 2 n=1 Tax=Vanderwaltozyma polyspora (strain ATCC 22028 / DSM 70294 / BCRC 21397 / CBS 2163 / NBRC 10782 / NRRL Y-8283 / UCD 57-17) TaxID=436907 RepID=A7TQ46_VANPO|nr:uncharacterized protein Kpol_1006p10 [Vanderwaltozyma polyspora DSM 70294]EDO15614.1 hypothetical protein Kpol_1006p10 [Vanderwaltozyma polyspora DSM 70294]